LLRRLLFNIHLGLWLSPKRRNKGIAPDIELSDSEWESQIDRYGLQVSGVRLGNLERMERILRLSVLLSAQCIVDVSSADDPGARPLATSSLDQCWSGFWVVFAARGIRTTKYE